MDEHTALKEDRRKRWWYHPELTVLTLLVISIYFCRLTTLPGRGEETRWAQTAVEMIDSGDWIVPHQQGVVFPERPPLGSWAMGAVALAQGKMDLFAARLPSVIAVLLTAYLVYTYAGTFLPRFGALVSAIASVTMMQIMQIGRHGESEPLFMLLVSGSLLIWHLGYMRRWPDHWMWLAGYSLCGLAALTKGLQAPIYFLAVTGVTLVLVERRWRRLFSWGHLLGIVAFLLIVGAWQVPFTLRAGWTATLNVWTGLAGDRLGTEGLLKHIVTYPLETLACLLPWSPMLACLVFPRFYKALGSARPYALYLITAVAVTYPSVWWATGARGRYFIPLYPCLAVLIGIIITRCVQAPAASALRRDWERFLAGAAIVIGLGGAFILSIYWLPLRKLAELRQSLTLTMILTFTAAAVTTCLIMLWARRDSNTGRSRIAVCALAGLIGLVHTGLFISASEKTANDFSPAVAQLKQSIPETQQLVSLGPAFHQFAFVYQTAIPEHPWPTAAEELHSEVDYFCFMRNHNDTTQERYNGRGRDFDHSTSLLPFAWEKVAEIPCGRSRRDWMTAMIVGKVVRLDKDPPPRVAETKETGENASTRLK